MPITPRFLISKTRVLVPLINGAVTALRVKLPVNGKPESPGPGKTTPKVTGLPLRNIAMPSLSDVNMPEITAVEGSYPLGIVNVV
jgi:hypothetical protein